MNKNILYGLVFIILLFSVIIPDTINPTKGFSFVFEETVSLVILILAVLLFHKQIAKVIEKLDKSYPWSTAIKKRFFIQLGIIILGVSIITIIIYLPTSYYYKKHGIPAFYQEILEKKEAINDMDDLFRDSDDERNEEWQLLDILASVAEFAFFGLLLIFLVEETYGYLNLQSRKKLELETILKEQAQLKASVLSKQLDPHFMFNTLNVLSGLIYKDVDKSAEFIKELSKVYRYVLEQSEELVSTVDQEFQFLESYMYLLQIRFDDKIPITIDIPDDKKDWLLPSMTLELLVENAIKHNVVDSERPLHLNFSIKDDLLIVKNNLQRRKDFKESLGLGLSNLKKRLELLGKKNYSFGVVEDEYVAVVPLINPEDV